MTKSAPSPLAPPEQSTTAPAPLHPNPAQIIVPRKHGQILIEPPLAKIAAALTHPPTPYSNPLLTTIFGQDFPTLRQSAKKNLLQAAHIWAQATTSPPPPFDALDHPFVLTGHQVEFYHAGVWAKVIAADELARRTNSLAFDLLVDHDVIDHLGFDVPTLTDSHWSKTLLQYAAPSPSLPAQFLPGPTPSEFTAWDEQLARHPAAQTDTLAHLLASLNPAHSPAIIPCSSLSYVPWNSAARAKLERALGLNVHHVPTSLLCDSDPWFHFITAWLQNVSAWTLAYNTHLAAYRHRQNITSPQHPMPDLLRTPDRLELPFWSFTPNSPRQRLFLRPASAANPTPILEAGPHQIPLPPTIFTPGPQSAQALRITLSTFSLPTQSSAEGGLSPQHSIFLRPRALTLTMYTRLFLSDLFLHGIGGALYDQITDALLLELFGLLPPYGCVSAAWLLPLGQAQEQTTTLAELRHHRHHLLHNPQLAINPFTALHTDIAELLKARRDLITTLTLSLKNHRTTERSQRRDQFRQLHTLNQTLHQKVPRILQSLDEETAQLEETQRQNKVLLNREYFFALHTTDSLTQLITSLRAR